MGKAKKTPKYLYVVSVYDAEVVKTRIRRDERIFPDKDEPGRWNWKDMGHAYRSGWDTFAAARAWMIQWHKNHYDRARAAYLRAIATKKARLR